MAINGVRGFDVASIEHKDKALGTMGRRWRPSAASAQSTNGGRCYFVFAHHFDRDRRKIYLEVCNHCVRPWGWPEYGAALCGKAPAAFGRRSRRSPLRGAGAALAGISIDALILQISSWDLCRGSELALAYLCNVQCCTHLKF